MATQSPHSLQDLELIGAIVDRAEGQLEADRMTTFLDLTKCHKVRPLRLQELLEAPPFEFAHDIHGINQHIDQDTGELRNCFVPRCAR